MQSVVVVHTQGFGRIQCHRALEELLEMNVVPYYPRLPDLCRCRYLRRSASMLTRNGKRFTDFIFN